MIDWYKRTTDLWERLLKRDFLDKDDKGPVLYTSIDVNHYLMRDDRFRSELDGPYFNTKDGRPLVRWRNCYVKVIHIEDDEEKLVTANSSFPTSADIVKSNIALFIRYQEAKSRRYQYLDDELTNLQYLAKDSK